ncbi:unnamed protein product [Caenorhabditis nigoni]
MMKVFVFAALLAVTLAFVPIDHQSFVKNLTGKALVDYVNSAQSLFALLPREPDNQSFPQWVWWIAVGNTAITDVTEDTQFRLSDGTSAYYVGMTVGAIQTEIMANGPVEASLKVYEDFYKYKSGVYKYTAGKMLGGHAIKIIGWGTENGTAYWLIANSWGTEWGENGFFKIRRGVNECGIERNVVAGKAKLDTL